MSDSDSSLDEEELEYQRQMLAKRQGGAPTLVSAAAFAIPAPITVVNPAPKSHDDDGDSDEDSDEAEYKRKMAAKMASGAKISRVAALQQQFGASRLPMGIGQPKPQTSIQPQVPTPAPAPQHGSDGSDSESDLDEEELEYQKKMAAKRAAVAQGQAAAAAATMSTGRAQIPMPMPMSSGAVPLPMSDELTRSNSSLRASKARKPSKRSYSRRMPAIQTGQPRWIYAGWLEKRGGSQGGLKTWKKRYFRIKQDRLQYFKDNVPDGRVLGELNLTGAVTRMANSDEGSGREFCWAIQHLGGRDLLVAAESQESMGDWLKVMRKVIQHQKRRAFDKVPGDHGLFLQGVLWKRKNKNWNQKWFMYSRLKDQCVVRWYEKKTDDEFEDEIVIDDSVTVGPSDIQDLPPALKNCGFVIRSSDQTLYLATRTPKDVKMWVQSIGGKSIGKTATKMTEQERLDAQLAAKRDTTSSKSANTMRGFLTKQGGSRGGKKTWRRRYCILEGMYLKYYRDEVESVAEGYDQMLGEVRIDDSSSRPATPDEAQGRQFTLAIQHMSEGIFLAQAESQMEMNQWIDSLRKTANFYKRLAFKFRAVSSNLDVLEGQLYKHASRGLKTWTERWFKLKGDTLSMYKTFDSTIEIGAFPLLTISSCIKSDVARAQGCGLAVMHGEDRDGSPLSLRLSAPTPSDAQRWIEGIQQYILAMKNTGEFTRQAEAKTLAKAKAAAGQSPTAPSSYSRTGIGSGSGGSSVSPTSFSLSPSEASTSTPAASSSSPAEGGRGKGIGRRKSIDLSGHLFKRGNTGLRKWHQRYFDVRGDELIYFRDRGLEPLGSIALNSIESIDTDAPCGKHQYCFTIYTSEKNYSMAANSQGESLRWIKGLTDAISGDNEAEIEARGAPTPTAGDIITTAEAISPDSSMAPSASTAAAPATPSASTPMSAVSMGIEFPKMEGYVSVKAGFGWKRKYATLKDGKLLVTSDASNDAEIVIEISTVGLTAHVASEDVDGALGKKHCIVFHYHDETAGEDTALVFDSPEDLNNWFKAVNLSIKASTRKEARTLEIMMKKIERLRLPRMNDSLSKKGGSGLTTHFKERSFSTEPTELVYYADEVKQGGIPYACMTRVQLTEESSGKSKGCPFVIHTTDRKDYLLVASTKADAMSWVTALERWRRAYSDSASEAMKAKQAEPEGLDLPSHSSELLWLVTSPGTPVWKKRLFSVVMDKIEFRISANTVALGYIPMRLVARVADASATASGQVPDQFRNNALVIVDQSKTYVLLAKTAADAEKWRSTLSAGLTQAEEYKKTNPMYGRKPDPDYPNAILKDDLRSTRDGIGVGDPAEFCENGLHDGSGSGSGATASDSVWVANVAPPPREAESDVESDITDSEDIVSDFDSDFSDDSDSELDDEEREFLLAKIKSEKDPKEGSTHAVESVVPSATAPATAATSIGSGIGSGGMDIDVNVDMGMYDDSSDEDLDEDEMEFLRSLKK